jgi:hypothetical protein
MALLEAVVFPPDHPPRVPCCRSCGTSCVLSGYGVAAAGEFEGIIERGVVVQEDGVPAVVTPPHGSACCAWAGGAATSSWAGPVPSTTLATSSPRRPTVYQPAVTRRPRRRRGAIAKAARRSVVEAESHRQNHIAVERNRRRQMNEYLAALRALMPPSYARRVRVAAAAPSGFVHSRRALLPLCRRQIILDTVRPYEDALLSRSQK